MGLRCSVGTYQLWLFWAQSGGCSLAGLKPQPHWALGKALSLLLPHHIFLLDTRVASRSFWIGSYSKTQSQLFQSFTPMQPWATWRNVSLDLTQRKQSQRKEWNSLLETSAWTLHTGKDPKESSGERNETIGWTEVQFYSPFDRIFFSVMKIRHNCVQPWAVKQNTTGTEMTFFFAAAALFCCFKRVLNTHMCVEIQFL